MLDLGEGKGHAGGAGVAALFVAILAIRCGDTTFITPTRTGAITTRVDGNGHTLLWWRFDWQQDDLASVCASHGADAKMVIEHRMQGPGITNALPACTNAEVTGHGDHACAMAGLVRLEIRC